MTYRLQLAGETRQLVVAPGSVSFLGRGLSSAFESSAADGDTDGLEAIHNGEAGQRRARGWGGL